MRKYVDPWSAVVLGVVMSFLNGCTSPIVGILFSEFITFLGVPFQFMFIVNDEQELDSLQSNIARGKEILEDKIGEYCLYLVAISGVTAISYFTSYKMFILLGTNLTNEVRKDLYDAILEKDIGWFDFPENGVSVITSAMAQDSSLINGVATSGIGPQVDASCSIIFALIVAFYYCWQEAIVCLLAAPFLMLGKHLAIHAQKKMSEEQNDKQKEADLLCGDSLVNLKTV